MAARACAYLLRRRDEAPCPSRSPRLIAPPTAKAPPSRSSQEIARSPPPLPPAPKQWRRGGRAAAAGGGSCCGGALRSGDGWMLAVSRCGGSQGARLHSGAHRDARPNPSRPARGRAPARRGQREVTTAGGGSGDLAGPGRVSGRLAGWADGRHPSPTGAAHEQYIHVYVCTVSKRPSPKPTRQAPAAKTRRAAGAAGAILLLLGPGGPGRPARPAPAPCGHVSGRPGDGPPPPPHGARHPVKAGPTVSPIQGQVRPGLRHGPA